MFWVSEAKKKKKKKNPGDLPKVKQCQRLEQKVTSGSHSQLAAAGPGLAGG